LSDERQADEKAEPAKKVEESHASDDWDVGPMRRRLEAICIE
jgi:hypothetical protein